MTDLSCGPQFGPRVDKERVHVLRWSRVCSKYGKGMTNYELENRDREVVMTNLLSRHRHTPSQLLYTILLVV